MFNNIYSIGCFDFFHHGHNNILSKMKSYGKKLVVGVHDDNSLMQ